MVEKDTCDKYGIAAFVAKRDKLDARLTRLYQQSQELADAEEIASKTLKNEEGLLLKRKSELMDSLTKIEVFMIRFNIGMNIHCTFITISYYMLYYSAPQFAGPYVGPSIHGFMFCSICPSVTIYFYGFFFGGGEFFGLSKHV